MLKKATEALRDAVTTDAVRDHLEALQAIADANDDTRAVETDGYTASVAYVVEQLEGASPATGCLRRSS
jgi:hypothetical protein